MPCYLFQRSWNRSVLCWTDTWIFPITWLRWQERAITTSGHCDTFVICWPKISRIHLRAVLWHRHLTTATQCYMVRRRKMSQCYNGSRTISLGWCYRNRKLFTWHHSWSRSIGFRSINESNTRWLWWPIKSRFPKRRIIWTSWYRNGPPLHRCRCGPRREHCCAQSLPGQIMAIGLSVLRHPRLGTNYRPILIFSDSLNIFKKRLETLFYLIVPSINFLDRKLYPCLCIFGLYDMLNKCVYYKTGARVNFALLTHLLDYLLSATQQSLTKTVLLLTASHLNVYCMVSLWDTAIVTTEQ